MDFKVGDVVQLKSGGPKMTIEEIFDEEKAKGHGAIPKLTVNCTFFADSEKKNVWFNKETLVKH